MNARGYRTGRDCVHALRRTGHRTPDAHPAPCRRTRDRHANTATALHSDCKRFLGFDAVLMRKAFRARATPPPWRLRGLALDRCGFMRFHAQGLPLGGTGGPLHGCRRSRGPRSWSQETRRARWRGVVRADYGGSTWGVPGRPADRTQRRWNAAPLTLRRARAMGMA